MKNKFKFLKPLTTGLFYSLVFLLPIFFLPWTSTLSGMDNFNKQIILFLLVPVLIFLLAFSKAKEKKLNFKYSIFDLPILVFLGVVAAASIFSLDKFSSVFGAYSYLELSFIVLVCLTGLYFFVVNYFSKNTEVSAFLKVFFPLYNLIVITSSILVFGYWTKILTSTTVSAWFKSGVGTLDDLAVFIAIMNVLIFGLLYDAVYAKNILKHIFCQRLVKTSIVLSFIFLILINFSPAWLCLFFGALFFVLVDYFYFGSEKVSFRKKLFHFTREKKYLWLNIAIMIPFLILVFNGLTYSSAVCERRSAQKLQMGQASSMELSRQVIKKRPIFGYGPETFNYAFSMLRSSSDNNSDYWYLRFNHGASYLINLIVATGVLGIVSYLVVLGSIIYIIFFTLKENKKIKDDKQNTVVVSIMATMVALICGQIFYSTNIVLLFLFWLFFALLMVCVRDYYKISNKSIFREKEFNDETSQRVLVMIMFSVFFIWIFIFGLLMRQWVADYYFKKSLSEQDFVVTEKDLIKAIKLNPGRYNYQVSIAKYYKERAMATMMQKDKSIDMVKSDIGNSIYWAKSAIKQAPYSVVTYETLGSIYRDLSPYIQGDNQLAIETFKQAVTLEPSNPVLASELGKAYLANSLYDEAIRAFQYSFNLRNDNYEAIFGMAKAMVAMGQEQEAMKLFDELEKKYPSADLYYEQGRILFNLKNYEAAIVKFQQVIGVSPLHANALYSLGLSLEANGEKELAMHYFKKVLELNPGNEEVRKKVNGL